MRLELRLYFSIRHLLAPLQRDELLLQFLKIIYKAQSDNFKSSIVRLKNLQKLKADKIRYYLYYVLPRYYPLIWKWLLETVSERLVSFYKKLYLVVNSI